MGYRLGKEVFSDEYLEFVRTKPEDVYGMPLGTVVLVKEWGTERPYRIVRWGKHKRKRLQYMYWKDFAGDVAKEYLPIRKTHNLQFRTEKKPARLVVRQAFSR